MKREISKGRNYFCIKYDMTDNSYPALIGKVTPQTSNCITAGLMILFDLYIIFELFFRLKALTTLFLLNIYLDLKRKLA
jgi:hypothetical protein